jgi:hypothetical protein
MGKRLVYWALRRLGCAALLPRKDPSLVGDYSDFWEEIGNYVYSISEREIEKVAWGMSYAACAFKGLNDYYEEGVEYEQATPDSRVFQRVQQQIAQRDRRCRSGLGWHAPRLLVAVIFKRPLPQPAVALLAEAGFTLKHLPENSPAYSETTP